MRVYFSLLMVALCCATPCFAGKKLHVLFLGNSYTHYNNMPQIVADMAATTGDTLVYDMYAPGGYTIDNHGQDTASENRIKKGGWDYLVLQEQSQLPSFPGYYSNELHGMCEIFRQYNPCGRIMFYMTWGRKNGDATNCPTWPPVCTYIGMDSLIRLRYTQMAIIRQGELSPVGAAWRHVRTNNPSVNLYEPDNSHPTASGSYLAAASFYTALFKKDPTLTAYNFSVGASTAAILKQAAKAVVFDSLSYWDYATPMPAATFSYTVGAGTNQVVFLNNSTLADNYFWEFGDGNTSTMAYPVHSYVANGTYTIKLTAFNCDLDTVYKHTYQSTVTFCAHTPIITPQKVDVCPGTSDTLFTQQYDSYQWYDITHNPIPGATSQYFVTSQNGEYYVKATQNGCTEMSFPARVEVLGSFSTWFIMAGGQLLGEDTACIGDTVTLSVWFNKPPVADDSLIDWSLNGQPITGYHNDSLYITQPGTYLATVRHAKCPSLVNSKQKEFTFIKCPTLVRDVEPVVFTIAPNPVSGALSVTSSLLQRDNCVIYLTDQLGRNLYTHKSTGATTQVLDMSQYDNGVYFITIQQNNNILWCGKVLKQ